MYFLTEEFVNKTLVTRIEFHGTLRRTLNRSRSVVEVVVVGVVFVMVVVVMMVVAVVIMLLVVKDSEDYTVEGEFGDGH